MIKKVAVFNDLSGFGKCSLTAAIPVLSVLGIQCNPIPTMVLTGQCGYPISFRKDMTDILPNYTKAWKENGFEFDGIYTGYMTCAEQIAHASEFIDVFRKEDTFLLVDPVMGDNGRTYKIFSKEFLASMKKLSRKANLITPNITEACLLSDTLFSEVLYLFYKEEMLEKVSEIAMKLQKEAEVPQDVIITGVKVMEDGEWNVYNVVLTQKGISLFQNKWLDKNFSGTGDLFTSAMCGLKMNGYSTEEAAGIAGEFIHKSVFEAVEDGTEGNDGVAFEKHLSELIKYMK